MDPKASSTSGKDMTLDEADEVVDEDEEKLAGIMLSSEEEEGKEACDASDGREGYDSNGGE
jgi:hypothetical protein